jgi:hypothetical protein
MLEELTKLTKSIKTDGGVSTGIGTEHILNTDLLTRSIKTDGGVSTGIGTEHILNTDLLNKTNLKDVRWEV